MIINFKELRTNFENKYSNIHENMKEDFEGSCAQKKGVKLPKVGTKKSITLTYLWQHKGEKVEKTFLDNLFDPGIDNQNARHLGRQNGFNIFQWGDIYNGERLKSGIYVFNETHYAWTLNRRRIDPNINWDKVKLLYGNKCACCGNIEGKNCQNDKTKIVSLEKCHKNPDLPLNIENIIPLCRYCNRHYQNRVIFNNQGLIDYFKYGNEWVSLRKR